MDCSPADCDQVNTAFLPMSFLISNSQNLLPENLSYVEETIRFYCPCTPQSELSTGV